MPVGMRRALSVGVVSLCVLVGGWVFVSGRALAVAPVVSEERVSSVEAEAATLQADIDPSESDTRYHFEYDTAPYTSSVSHGSSVSMEGDNIEADIGSGSSPEPVEVRLKGLRSATVYHYRVVASSECEAGEQCVADGSDKTFTTPAAPGSAPSQGCPNEQLRAEQPFGLTLPDCRAYEMVSPHNTSGQDAATFSADSTARASDAPEGTEPAVTYAAEGSYGSPDGALVESEYLARRTPNGWDTENVTPLSSPEHTEQHEDSYPTPFFTPELTQGIAVTSAQLNEEVPSLGGNFGVYLAQFASHAYQYLGTTDTSEMPWGASSDLKRVVLTRHGGVLVEEDNGTEVPVSVTNSGEELRASAGSAELESQSYQKDAWHSTSEDGSRVYFTAPFIHQESEIAQLYVRVNVGASQSAVGGGGECLEPAGGCTIEVSASKRKPEDPVGPRTARYWGASADGAKVFFTSDSELTQDAYTGADDNAANLYQYDLETGELSDLTVDSADAAEGAAVQGVVQISEDGSYVYFVAEGKLAAGAVQGEPNLYVSHDGGPPVLITTLAAKDNSDWLNLGISYAGPEINTAVVTPSGGELAFVSERPLPTVNFPSGYDNQQATAGDCEATLENQEHETGACREVYLYDTETETLDCVSCNPSGARPVGPARIPGIKPGSQAFASYRPRDLLASGALFFDSEDALVPHASDGRENVYEYEGGEVRAISNVAGGYLSFFLDSSPGGGNVFFASADRLLPEDRGGNTVVWDARVGGGFPVVVSLPPCDNGDSCKPPESPQPAIFGAPASATFSGPGNLAPAPASAVTVKTKTAAVLRAERLAMALRVCEKDKKRATRARCERRARSKGGAAKKAKGSSNDRRTK